jgi:hypothetical protein
MAYARMQHTHLNPKRPGPRGHEVPMFVVIDGPKEQCKECQSKEKEDARRATSSQGRTGRR